MNQLKNAKWMTERGHSVFLLCISSSPIEKAAKEFGIPIVNIECHKKYFDFKKGKILAQIIDENKITHLITRDTRDMSVAVIAKRNVKEKIHLSYFMEMQLGVKKKNIFHSIRFSYFDLWSCPLHWLQEQVESMTHFTKEKIVVIPSGIDLSIFKNVISVSEAREALNLPKGKIIFGLIGRFDRHKGQLLLLEALSKIDDSAFCVCLLGESTVGEGQEYFNNMNDLIKKNNLVDRAFIRPFRKDIATFFYAMDAFVMASKAETFGMVTIESLACGIPVLASNAGGSPEILGYGEFGLLFEPLNANSLAEKMKHFVEFPSEFSSELLKEEAKKYDNNGVCKMVEEKLGLNVE